MILSQWQFSGRTVRAEGTENANGNSTKVTWEKIENSGYGNAPMTTIAGDYEYIIINGPGVDANDNVGQAGEQFLALGRENVEGKVVFCFRGSSSFWAKANAAIGQGAAALFVINNLSLLLRISPPEIFTKEKAVSFSKTSADLEKSETTSLTKLFYSCSV